MSDKTVAGNLLGGLLEGVQTHVLGEGEQPPQLEAPKFPNEDEDGEVKGTQVEVFGMKPVTFGLIVVGVIGASVLGVVLYKKYAKK